jgi:hypothetical protein
VLPTAMAKDSPNDRHQASSSGIHMHPMILWKEKEPHIDPMDSFVNNLQELSMVCIVKDDIIIAIPNCP